MAKRLQKKSYATLAALVVLVVVLLVLLFWWAPSASEQPQEQPQEAPQEQVQPSIEETTIVKVGEEAPDFEVTMFDGAKVRLSDLKGKVVLVNFWATWCPPCRQEMARVEKEIIERFKGDAFVFLPISRGEAKEEVASFREKTGYIFPMGLDPEQTIYKKYATNYIPRNYLIGRDGKIVKISVGYDDAEFAELVKAIEQAVK